MTDSPNSVDGPPTIKRKTDRRSFLSVVSAVGAGLVACGPEPFVTGPKPPPLPARPSEPGGTPPSYATFAERAMGVADGLLNAAVVDESGTRWNVLDTGTASQPVDLYTGQAGILTFLAEAYAFEPRDEIRQALESGGWWLRSHLESNSRALYEGYAGQSWALLSIHEALDDEAEWLDAAAAYAPSGSPREFELAGDLINGVAGQGLLLLRLYAMTGDEQWLARAREKGDHVLAQGVPEHGGIKFPSFQLSPGVTVFYTGMAHGSAGAGYFLCRLAEASAPEVRDAYLEGAISVATWLAAIARPQDVGVNWHRREPDQLNQEQVQWCHGAPGIGIFHAELARLSGDAAHFDMALRCAEFVEHVGGEHWSSCQCHGVAGNAQLFLKLFRETDDEVWLQKALAFGSEVWSRRLPNRYYPAWTSGDGSGHDNPGLMTGTAGIGWFWLQLARDGRFGGPVTA